VYLYDIWLGHIEVYDICGLYFDETVVMKHHRFDKGEDEPSRKAQKCIPNIYTPRHICRLIASSLIL
jgi:hypothetical protein